MADIVYAEDVHNYFKTSQTHAATWIERAKKEISSIGGSIISEGSGTFQNKTVFMIEFRLGGEIFKINWSVLPCRYKGNEKAAIIQAATMLYHDVKHKCVMAKIKGVNRAFLEYLMLPNGAPAGEIANDPRQILPLVLALPEKTG